MNTERKQKRRAKQLVAHVERPERRLLRFPPQQLDDRNDERESLSRSCAGFHSDILLWKEGETKKSITKKKKKGKNW